MERDLSVMYRFVAALALDLPAWLSAAAQSEAGRLIDGHPFREYSTLDKLSLNVTLYDSEPQVPDQRAPIVVYVQGTRCSSHFRIRGGRVFRGSHSLDYDTFCGRARIATVEKPGVESFDDPGERSMQESYRSEVFYEHTLERWSEAIAAAIRSAHTLPEVDGTSTLVVGV